MGSSSSQPKPSSRDGKDNPNMLGFIYGKGDNKTEKFGIKKETTESGTQVVITLPPQKKVIDAANKLLSDIGSKYKHEHEDVFVDKHGNRMVYSVKPIDKLEASGGDHEEASESTPHTVPNCSLIRTDVPSDTISCIEVVVSEADLKDMIHKYKVKYGPLSGHVCNPNCSCILERQLVKELKDASAKNTSLVKTPMAMSVQTPVEYEMKYEVKQIGGVSHKPLRPKSETSISVSETSSEDDDGKIESKLSDAIASDADADLSDIEADEPSSSSSSSEVVRKISSDKDEPDSIQDLDGVGGLREDEYSSNGVEMKGYSDFNTDDLEKMRRETFGSDDEEESVAVFDSDSDDTRTVELERAMEQVERKKRLGGQMSRHRRGSSSEEEILKMKSPESLSEKKTHRGRRTLHR